MAARFVGLLILLFFMAPTAALAAEPDAKIAPLLALEGIEPKTSIFELNQPQRPAVLVLHNVEQARKHFEENAIKALADKVDFTQQMVLVFAWRGSGQDRLEARVAESYPEQVTFHLSPGRTRDLREHVRMFAIRSNVKWTVR